MNVTNLHGRQVKEATNYEEDEHFDLQATMQRNARGLDNRAGAKKVVKGNPIVAWLKEAKSSYTTTGAVLGATTYFLHYNFANTLLKFIYFVALCGFPFMALLYNCSVGKRMDLYISGKRKKLKANEERVNGLVEEHYTKIKTEYENRQEELRLEKEKNPGAPPVAAEEEMTDEKFMAIAREEVESRENSKTDIEIKADVAAVTKRIHLQRVWMTPMYVSGWYKMLATSDFSEQIYFGYITEILFLHLPIMALQYFNNSALKRWELKTYAPLALMALSLFQTGKNLQKMRADA